MTNFEDLTMRNELTKCLIEKIVKYWTVGEPLNGEDIESFAKWLQQDADDVLISRSDVIKVLKSHLDKNTIYNDQFQKLVGDIDYIEPRGQIKSEEVKHSEWDYDKVPFYRICPECGCGIEIRDENVFLDPVNHKANYCPNCGTKMEKGE